MSYKQKSRRHPNVNLDNNKRIPPKPCSEETNDYVSKLVSGKLDRIEEIINNFDKNLSNQSTAEFSKFNAKFTLNNVPCELEYDLSNFTLENLQKLVMFTTQNCNNSNNNPSSISSSASLVDYLLFIRMHSE